MATALQGKNICKNFQLDRNQFVDTRDGIEFAVKSIETNLERLQWVNNEIERMEDARYLVDAIIHYRRIEHIRLENCLGEDINGYEILQSLLSSGKRFLSIDLDGNNIRTGGGTAISDFLSTNPPLKQLFLEGNHLNDDDAILIARALKRNNNLKHLRLGDNDWTEKGKNALSKVIYDSTSLNSVMDCNHRCDIEDIRFDGILENYSNMTPKGNRAMKIYHLLSLRNREGSNVQHLNVEFEDDDSLALVHRVLESVYRYSRSRSVRGFVRVRQLRLQPNTVHPLSIMYEILRSWKMPELYENSGAQGRLGNTTGVVREGK